MDLRSSVLQHLATPGTDSRFNDAYMVTPLARQTGCAPHEVWEALWGLVAEGLVYLYPNRQPSPDNWQWRLSKIGISAATGGSWDPHDAENYLGRLRKHTPPLDAAALDYVEEALRAFNARCYLAASVMLGVASERVFEGVAWSAIKALGPSATKLRQAMENPRTSQAARFTALRAALEPHRGGLPQGLADNLTLDAVAELLRITRNDAGHPTGAVVDEDTAYTHLQMGARYLQKMTSLQAHFDRSVQHDELADA
jgi:hypothetical protein